jgi:hypothetical protein
VYKLLLSQLLSPSAPYPFALQPLQVAAEHLLLCFAAAKPVPDSSYNHTGSFLALLPPAADQNKFC